MFYKRAEGGYRQMLPGIQVKTLVYGERSLLAEFHLAGGADLPRHQHPQEQVGYMISGRMRFTIGETTHDVGPGDSWCIAGGVEHQAQVLEDAVVVEVFAPRREDLMP